MTGLCSLNDKSISLKTFYSFMIIRNRTPSKYVYYGLYLYFSGLVLKEILRKIISDVSNEIMFQSGTGFKSIILERYQSKEKESQNILLMKH